MGKSSEIALFKIRQDYDNIKDIVLIWHEPAIITKRYLSWKECIAYAILSNIIYIALIGVLFILAFIPYSEKGWLILQERWLSSLALYGIIMIIALLLPVLYGCRHIYQVGRKIAITPNFIIPLGWPIFWKDIKSVVFEKINLNETSYWIIIISLEHKTIRIGLDSLENLDLLKKIITNLPDVKVKIE